MNGFIALKVIVLTNSFKALLALLSYRHESHARAICNVELAIRVYWA